MIRVSRSRSCVGSIAESAFRGEGRRVQAESARVGEHPQIFLALAGAAPSWSCFMTMTNATPLIEFFIIATVCTFISLVASLLLLWAWWQNSQRSFCLYWTLIKWLALSDVGASIGDLLIWAVYHTVDDLPCLMGSLFIQIFDWASVAWVACIAHHMYYHVACTKTVTDESSLWLLRWYHLFVWGSTIVLALVPLSAGFGFNRTYSAYGSVYGYDGDWCWLSFAAPPYWSIILFYGGLWIVEIFVIGVIVLCRLKLQHFIQDPSRATETDGVRNAREVYKHLLGYPIVLVLTWSVGSVRRLWIIFEPSIATNIPFASVHLALGSLGGFFNYIFFLFSHPKAREKDLGARTLQIAASRISDVAARRTSSKPSNGRWTKRSSEEGSNPPGQVACRGIEEEPSLRSMASFAERSDLPSAHNTASGRSRSCVDSVQVDIPGLEENVNPVASRVFSSEQV